MFKKIAAFIILLVITIPSISSLFRIGYFPIHDDIQTMRLFQMDKCVKDLQIPCRWVPDMGYGYGYPQFNYYGPTPYYVMELFHLLGFSLIASVKFGFGLSLFLSALGMYLLAKAVWKDRYAGFLSSLFYLYFPYHAVDIYVRGAMGEAWALAFMPFIFYSIYEIFQDNKNSILYLAFSVFFLSTSHNISTLIFIPFCAVWVIYLLLNKNNNYVNKIKQIAVGVAWGGMLSSFFILPAWFEKNLVHVETITQGYFNYLAHYVGLGQLLLSTFWGYGSSELGDFDDIFLGVSPLWWVMPIFVLILFLLIRRKEFKTLSVLIISALFALFMIHPKSVFIWQKISLLNFVQFPWRFLGPALFLLSLSAGALMITNVKRFWILGIFFIIIVGFFGGFFTPSRYIEISDKEKFSGRSWILQQTISIFDYLPKDAKLPPVSAAPESLTSELQINVASDSKGSNWRTWSLNVSQDNTIIKIPIFYFPGWVAMDNNNKIDIVPEKDSGIMTIKLNKGEHLLKFKLKDTPVRRASNIISFIAFVLILYYPRIKKYLYAEN